MSSITDIHTESLTTESELGSKAITMRFIGTAEAEVKSQLDVYCKRAHEVAIESAVQEVVLDLRALEFMNSSCLNAFVTWIGAVQDVPVESQYSFRFLSDSRKAWQGRCLTTLKCFAVDLINVETT